MRKFVVSIAAFCALAACNHIDSRNSPNTEISDAPVFVVFFHFDRADLSPIARQIVDQAARSALATKPAAVDIAGYTDVPNAPDGRRLAELRFKSVEGALIADGVGRELLARTSLADTEASLPATADRRVEIRLVKRQHS